MQFNRVNSDPDETDGLLGVIDKVGLNILFIAINGNKIVCLMPYALEETEKASWEETNILFGKKENQRQIYNDDICCTFS